MTAVEVEETAGLFGFESKFTDSAGVEALDDTTLLRVAREEGMGSDSEVSVSLFPPLSWVVLEDEPVDLVLVLEGEMLVFALAL